jgi:hypothetical protein
MKKTTKCDQVCLVSYGKSRVLISRAMKKRLIFFLTCVLVFINCTHTQAQQPTYRNNITKVKDSSDYRFKNTLYLGYNFYTFDNTGLSGLYPTIYTLNYKRSLSKTKHTYWEIGWNFFYPSIGTFLYSSGNKVPYASKKHIFNTLHGGIGKRLLNNALGVSIGLNYKYGVEGEAQYVPNVGYGNVTYVANSPGIHASLNYQFILKKRFVIEPIARYEYYFQGITSHYMIGLNAGYKF